MLVLALQFSKGIAGVGIVAVETTELTLTRHTVAEEPKLVPCERDDSLKTEEKTKSVVSTTRGGEPTTLEI